MAVADTVTGWYPLLPLISEKTSLWTTFFELNYLVHKVINTFDDKYFAEKKRKDDIYIHSIDTTRTPHARQAREPPTAIIGSSFSPCALIYPA